MRSFSPLAARPALAAAAKARPAAAPRAQAPAPAPVVGVPRFLGGRPRLPFQPRMLSGGAEAHEREAARAAEPSGTPAPVSAGAASGAASVFDRAVADAARRDGAGAPLPAATRAAMEARLGADLSGVRVHAGGEAARVARGIGANAFTVGQGVYFGENRWAPGSAEGDRLLAHELAHAVQQGPGGERVQCDLMMSLPTTLGGFEIGMATTGAPRPGMDGEIRFLPDPGGPYSARIGLIQAVNVTDRAARTAPAGDPVDWSGVGTGDERDRAEAMTTGTHGAPRGHFIDALYADLPRGSSRGPHYLEPDPEGVFGEYGWLRSPTDVKAATLTDAPFMTFDVDFDFETVAKGADNQAVYGALHWGFGIRSGAVTGEYAHAVDAQSATFDEALERFRGFYTHETVILYFDTDVDVPLAGEDAKLADVPDYLSRYPDTLVEVRGWADERASRAHNLALSRRRARSVEAILLGMGIPASRIHTVTGGGETDVFSPPAPGTPAGTPPHAGMLLANRRVEVSFVRTASSPIVMP